MFGHWFARVLVFFGIAVGGIAIGLVAAVHIVPPPPPRRMKCTALDIRQSARRSWPEPAPDCPAAAIQSRRPQDLVPDRQPGHPHQRHPTRPSGAWSGLVSRGPSGGVPAITGDGGSRNFSFRPVDRSPPCRGLPGLIGASGRDQHPGQWANGPTAQYCFLSQVPHASTRLFEGLLRQLAGPHPIFPQLAPELPDLGAQVSDAVPVSVRIFAGPAAVSC